MPRKSVEMGASAIIVSNHIWSGHVFSVPSIMSLPKIVKAVGSKVTVLVDSGFRTGDDVFKALALGAKAVGFTTSVVSAACAGGAGGVERLIGFHYRRTEADDGDVRLRRAVVHRWLAARAFAGAEAVVVRDGRYSW